MPPGRATIAEATYQDNVVYLNEMAFWVDGPIRAGAVSEFTTGLKIGAATYDEREHAFWAVLSDFSGGIGARDMDIRGAGGNHWDNVGGVDLRRPSHITLPGLRTRASADSNAGAIVGTGAPFHPSMLFSSLGGSAFLHMGMGNTLFTMDTSGNMVKRLTHPDGGNRRRCTTMVDFRGSDGTRRLYAMFGRATEGYYFSTDGTTWAVGSGLSGQSGTKLIMDTIKWDDLMVAFVRRNSDAREGIGATADGVNWDVDDDTIGFHWETLGDISWVGVAMAPWGASAPYFIDGEDGRLFAMDWYVYNAVPIEGLGDDSGLHRGVVWNGQIAVTDWRRVWLFDPASGGQIRDIGPFGERQLPNSWIDNDYRIVQLIAGSKDLFALCYAGEPAVPSTAEFRIAVYNETGWTWFGPAIVGVPWAASIGHLTTFSTGAVRRRMIHVVDHEAVGNLASRLHTIRLSDVGDVAYSGANEAFEDGPLDFEMGWFNGGFSELEGVLIRLGIDGYGITETETVKVEYRLNNSTDSAYTLLGTFTSNQQELWFPTDHQGLPFKTVQFRVTLDRGSDISVTPELKALILLFDKKPLMRTSWTIRIDVSRMIEVSATLEGEETATYESIWQQLKTYYNTPKLLRLRIPSMESGGINVRITDMPASLEDFRKSAGGKGFIQLEMIETISD